MRLAIVVCLIASTAWADEPGQLSIGARFGTLHLLSTSGGEAGNKTEDQGIGFGAGVYADWQVERHLRVGVVVPSVLNGPGPTTNEYDVGFGLRVVGQTPLAPRLDAYVSLEPSVQFARLPESIWWTGHALNIGAGVRQHWGPSASVIAQVSLAFESFSGTVADPATGAMVNGSVNNAFIGGALGIEFSAL